MNEIIHRLTSRRRFLQSAALGIAAFGAHEFFAKPNLFAQELARTPRLTEGPYYPDRLPLDTDNDLIIVNDSITPAVGEITHLTGRVLDQDGTPVRNAVVEIWQCDANAVYHHSGDDAGGGTRQLDTNFQSFGRFATSTSGAYYFRTIKPIAYPGRPAPHIHVKVKRNGRDLLTTQLFINGYPNNGQDSVYRGLRTPLERQLVLADFRPIPESRIGEYSANWDIVIGRTPES